MSESTSDESHDPEFEARVRLTVKHCDTPEWEIRVVLEAAGIPALLAERSRMAVALRHIRDEPHGHLAGKAGTPVPIDHCCVCSSVHAALFPLFSD